MINDDSGIDGFLSPKYVRHLPQNTLCPHIIGPNSRGGMDGYRKIGDICGGGVCSIISTYLGCGE